MELLVLVVGFASRQSACFFCAGALGVAETPNNSELWQFVVMQAHKFPYPLFTQQVRVVAW